MENRSSVAATLATWLSILFAGAVLASCTSMPPISTDIDYCCQTGTEGVSSYRIEFKDMPEFLKPMLRDEVSVVLDRKGLAYTEGDAHAILTMSFVHRPLTTQDVERDDFSSTLSPGGDSRFIAEVHVRMTNSVTGDLLWSGMLSRFHNVTVGSYMHDAPARAAMRTAFTELFADYPNRQTEDM